MNVFDIIGPVMIGPSSSHTAGAVRIGNAARMLLGKEPCKAEMYLSGSFAETGKGHGTDKALIAGLLGMRPDDERIVRSLEIAKNAGLHYHFDLDPVIQAHPNTVTVNLEASDGTKTSMRACSVGGGNISITRVNEMPVQFSGRYDTMIVLHKDVPGVIERVAAFLAEKGVNIASFRSDRTQKGGAAIMTVEADGTIPNGIDEEVNSQRYVFSCVIINKIL